MFFCVSMWSINRTLDSAVYPVVDTVRSRRNREREHTQLAEMQGLTTSNHVYSSQCDGIALVSLADAKSAIISYKWATSTTQFVTPKDMICKAMAVVVIKNPFDTTIKYIVLRLLSIHKEPLPEWSELVYSGQQ